MMLVVLSSGRRSSGMAEFEFVPLAAVSNVLADEWNRVYLELNVSVRPRARG